MNKYASLYLNKLSEVVDGDPHINKDSKKQDPGIAGGLGLLSSLTWPLGSVAPGIYAGVQSKSLGEGIKATGNGLLWPAVGTIGGGLAGAATGGVAGFIIDQILSNQGGVNGMRYNFSQMGRDAIPPVGAGALTGLALGGILGGPIAGYLGSRNAARKYNERLKQELSNNKEQLAA